MIIQRPKMPYNRQNYEERFILKWITLAFIQCIYNIPKLGDFRYLSFPNPLLPCQLGAHANKHKNSRFDT